MSLGVTLKFTSAEIAEKHHAKLYVLMPAIGPFTYTEGEYGGIYLSLRNLTSEDLLIILQLQQTSEDLFIIDQLVKHEDL